jgi:DNA-directed RNA polymerase specialized sigma24 family protein
MPALRAAVERSWPETRSAAASVLGDEALGAEIMERAIEKTVAFLVDHPTDDDESVYAVLSRFCRLEIKRRRKQGRQFAFIDFSRASETAQPITTDSTPDAALDAEKFLSEAPRKVREALMMRYGSSESWSDVAARTGTSPEAIRKKCERYLDRLRQRLGISNKPL